MQPWERRETGDQDLFRSRLDQIIDLRHPLVRLARETDWGFLERTFGEAYEDGPGQPPLGPFYEIESSSPAAALAPGQTIQHVHRTMHLQGPESELDEISRAVLGVSIVEIVRALP